MISITRIGFVSLEQDQPLHSHLLQLEPFVGVRQTLLPGVLWKGGDGHSPDPSILVGVYLNYPGDHVPVLPQSLLHAFETDVSHLQVLLGTLPLPPG